jgi:hypothetical protein
MQPDIVQSTIDSPLYSPTYLNIEYVFAKILSVIKPIIDFLTDPHTWSTLGFISSLFSLIFIAIIIYSLVRMREIQNHEKQEIDHEIREALARDKEKERNENPRWHYILTLVESPNESDWRVSIIEADTMLDELLRDKGYTGDTLSELLEEARNGGLPSIQNAWDAHLVRNQIAHEGSNFSLTQIEARRVIKMFQNVFEELGAI